MFKYSKISSLFSGSTFFSISFLFIFLLPLQFEASKAVNAETADVTSTEAAEVAKQNFISHAKSLYAEAGLIGTTLKYEVFEKALTGFYNLKKGSKSSEKDILTIIDFEQSSLNERMFSIDIKNKKLLFNSVVAHGRNSGNLYAKQFSNKPNSYQSSLGFYVTGETYTGKHGLSLRLDGMDAGYNDKARARAIVMHSANYANPSFGAKTGRLGRSLGCPSIPELGHEEVIKTLSEGTVIYIHYPNTSYEKSCVYFNTQVAVDFFSTIASL
ncbi:MAG: murein L,D-transpeptidase catalytic domain family protein [Bacteroidia bacterium]